MSVLEKVPLISAVKQVPALSRLSLELLSPERRKRCPPSLLGPQGLLFLSNPSTPEKVELFDCCVVVMCVHTYILRSLIASPGVRVCLGTTRTNRVFSASKHEEFAQKEARPTYRGVCFQAYSHIMGHHRPPPTPFPLLSPSLFHASYNHHVPQTRNYGLEGRRRGGSRHHIVNLERKNRDRGTRTKFSCGHSASLVCMAAVAELVLD